MITLYPILKGYTNSVSICSMLLAPLLIIAGCGTTTKLENINRAEIPQAYAHVPATTSEIREIKYYSTPKEKGHKDLHIAGQVFTKSLLGGSSYIKPCGNCIVLLTSPADTSIKINVTTESDGYFSYHGQNRPYKLTLANAGHNRVEIGPVEFTTEGATVFKIINAAGSGSETISVTRNGKNYSWQ